MLCMMFLRKRVSIACSCHSANPSDGGGLLISYWSVARVRLTDNVLSIRYKTAVYGLNLSTER